MKHTILMADIIGSSEKLPSELMSEFKQLVQITNKSYQKSITSPLTITLGDEFQGIIENLSSALEIIIHLEETIIHLQLDLKLKYVLHFGEIETMINTKNSYEMLGSGLTSARKQLNELKKSERRFTISIDNPIQNQVLTDCFIIFEILVDKWRLEKDYKIVSSFLKYQDYKIVSTKLNKNRSLMWKRKKSLNLVSYNSIKNIILTTSKL